MPAAWTLLTREVDSYRLYLQTLHSIRIGRVYDVIVAFLYIVYCAVYIVNTAFPKNSPVAMDSLELALAVIFLVSWLLELFAASSRLRFLITVRLFYIHVAVNCMAYASM